MLIEFRILDNLYLAKKRIQGEDLQGKMFIGKVDNGLY